MVGFPIMGLGFQLAGVLFDSYPGRFVYEPWATVGMQHTSDTETKIFVIII